MKKLLVMAAIALGTVGVSQAQEIDFGVQAGVNFATLSGDDTDGADLESRTGINVGITGEYQFNQQFGLLVGAIYSQQGYKLEEEGFEEKLKLDYINVPVLAKFYLGGSGFAIEAGPQVGILVGDDIELEGGGESVSESIDAESIDFSALGGLSYKFKEGTTLEGVAFGARYQLGLTDVIENVEARNSVFSLNLGYKF